MKKIFYLFLLFILPTICYSQKIGFGLTASNDIYHIYFNPEDGLASPSAGSALLNLSAGPKVWIGGRDMTFSLEGQAGIGFLGLSLGDYKGLGTASFPIMAKLNFNGLSTMDKEGQLGLSIGGGIQYAKTELFGLNDKFENLGVKREMFRTYIAQAGYGFGLAGFGLQGFLRYGWNGDKARTYSLGIQWDFNFSQFKKIKTKESSL
jgi:hypothetical protein